MSGPMFADRRTAGRALAGPVAEHLAGSPVFGRPLVLALPRGGVPVAAAVAEWIGGDIDVVIARKIGAPGQPEFGVGAIAEDMPPVFDAAALRHLGIAEADLADAVDRERAELGRRVRQYRGGRPVSPVDGRAVVVVDDGLATGATARAALRWVRDQRPTLLVLAVPVCSRQAGDSLRDTVDAVVCLHAPERFRAVGQWYADFHQLTDDDVVRALRAGTGIGRS